MSERAILHTVAGRPGSALARWLDRSTAPYGELRPLVGPFSRPIVRISCSDALLDQAAESLPEGIARTEAIAVRLRRAGVDLSWGEPDVLPDTASFVRLCHARGASSVETVQPDPSLRPGMTVGALFHAYWPRRALRHATIPLGVVRSMTRFRGALDFAADLVFWAGVCARATS